MGKLTTIIILSAQVIGFCLSSFSVGAQQLSTRVARLSPTEIREVEYDTFDIPIFLNQRMVVLRGSNNQYLGFLTEIKPRIFIGAAHVIAKVAGDRELFRLLKLKPGTTAIYQLKQNNLFLDIAIVTDVGSQRALQELRVLTTNECWDCWLEGNHRYLANHLTFIDHKIVRQQSKGVVANSSDSRDLYLSVNYDNFLTWGSSGALVYSENLPMAIGIVQCVVHQSSPSGLKTYFRAISSKIIQEATLVKSHLAELQARIPEYKLKNCNPVGAKDGGGG